MRVSFFAAGVAALAGLGLFHEADARPPEETGKDLYRSIALEEAKRNGVPFEMVDAVMAVESAYDPAARGDAGEVGLMQVLPSTAAMLGFEGSREALGSPQVNIAYGARYLARAWRLAGGDICTAVMKYRAGHGETRFSQRSVDYCIRVRAKLKAAGFPVTGSIPEPTFGLSDDPRPSLGPIKKIKLKNGRIRVRFSAAGLVNKTASDGSIAGYCRGVGGGAKRIASCMANETGARRWVRQAFDAQKLYRCTRTLHPSKSGYVAIRGCMLANG